ncbi:MAG: TlpA disulfide reductase family protein [Lutibacter sp.]
MKKLIFLLLIISIFSFKEKTNSTIQNSENEFTINAKVENLKDGLTIILTKGDSRNFDFKDIDSTLSSDGTFSFKGNSKNPSKYYISIRDYKAKVGKNIHLWIENGITSINGSYDDFENSKIEGSSLNKIDKQHASIMVEFNKQMEEELKLIKDEKEKKPIYDKYYKLINKEQLGFIYKYPNNYFSLSNLIIYENSISKDSLQLFYSQLDTVLQNSDKGLALKDFFTTERIKIGGYYKDFEAKDLNGNNVKLSNFKGKVILLDFWAWWCHWCHTQNLEEFSYLNKKYGKDNVVIVSYSLDTNKKLWEKYSKNDKIDWVNISNLKGFDDPIAIYFGIQSLPNSFLIDQNGILIKSFVGYDPENNTIEKEIDKLLE